jgi:hypothetical protein
LEATLNIGRSDGWWNRKVPIARICLIAGVLLAGLYVWGNYGDLIENVAWGARHQKTVSFRGQTLKVPWLWREEEWINYNEFELTRSYRGFPIPSPVTVRYENIAPGDIQRRMEIMRNSSTQSLKVPDWFYNDYEGGDFTKAHYVCQEQSVRWSPLLIVNCFSRDGRWTVDMFGLKQTRPEFETILRGEASMGNPTK